jgi:hypothetical protein
LSLLKVSLVAILFRFRLFLQFLKFMLPTTPAADLALLRPPASRGIRSVRLALYQVLSKYQTHQSR